MVVVDWKQRGLSLEARGRYGEPCGVGDYWLGLSSVGEYDEMQGVYQKRPRKGGQIFVRMRYGLNSQKFSQVRQDNRTKFGLAIIAWNALPFDQQVIWNKRRYPVHCSGYNRFIGWYMKNA